MHIVERHDTSTSVRDGLVRKHAGAMPSLTSWAWRGGGRGVASAASSGDDATDGDATDAG